MSDASTPATRPRILYCHCAYAHVVPRKTKEAVLRALTDSGVAFDAVPDLCEMAARRDPSLKTLVASAEGEGGCQIAACYPRAVKWLFHSAGTPLPDEGVDILNMRTDDPQPIIDELLPRSDESPQAGGLKSTSHSTSLNDKRTTDQLTPATNTQDE